MVPYLAILCAHSLWKPLEFILRHLLFVHKCFLQPTLSRTCQYKGKIYLRMYGDLLWCLIWLLYVPIHFENHWNLFSNIYYSCTSGFCNPHFPKLATKGKFIWECIGTSFKRYLIWHYYVSIHYKGKSIWECIGTSYGTLSDSIVCPFTLKTIGV